MRANISICRVLAAAFIVFAFGGCGKFPEQTAAHSTDQPVLAPNDVNIYRDEWGVAHIYAHTEEAGYFGLGYARAEDQLERFLLTVLHARGELAAHVDLEDLPAQFKGSFPSAAAMVNSDYQMKLWRIMEFSEAAVERLDPQLRKNYRGFLAGLTAYLEEHPARAPVWAPRDISLADLVAIPSAQTWLNYQAGTGLNDCLRGGVRLKSVAPQTSYSNEWALAPARTATGGAILLSDPHPGGDGRYVYEFRMHAGDLRMAGYSYGPALLLGRNQYLGWAFTTGGPDVADCYEVETLDDDQTAYKYGEETRRFDSRTIEINVKGGDTITIEAKYSDHNGQPSPVVAEEQDRVYVVSTPYLSNLEGVHNAIYAMNKARNVDEFKEAQRAGWMFSQNLMAADIHGDIFYIRMGMAPVRPDPGVDWMRPVNGNSSEFAWRGIHPVDDLLSIRSPTAGYLQNNNVHPRKMDLPPPENIEGMPEYLLDDGGYVGEDPSGRGLRALEIFADIEDVTEEDAFRLAFDAKLVATSRWINLLRNALQRRDVMEGFDAERRAYADDLLSFDGVLASDSTAALKYIYWREALRARLDSDDVDPLVAAVEDEQVLTSALEEAFVKAVNDAYERSAGAPNGLERKYGDEFRVAGREGRSWPMSGGSVWPNYDPDQKVSECSPYAIRMCPTALLAMRYSNPDENGERFVTAGSAIMRLDFYSPEGIRSFTAQRPGVSDDPLSPHYDDQAEKLFSRGAMKPVHFYWKDLQPHVQSKKVLTFPTSK